jgi:uncharacterized membrane protein YdjX (TVP38/TMEM64 family)
VARAIATPVDGVERVGAGLKTSIVVKGIVMKRGSSHILKGVAILLVIVVIVLAEKQYHLSSYLHPDRIKELLASAGSLAPVLFILMMTTAVVVSPIPSLPLDIAAGVFFGPVIGTLYAALGALIGSMVCFLIARFLGRELIERLLRGHINFCQGCSDKLLTLVVFLSRLLPIVSFDVISYGAGLTKMSLSKFSVATFFGTLPLTFVYVSFGASFIENHTLALIAGIVFVALFFFLPRWIERYNFLSLQKYFQH